MSRWLSKATAKATARVRTLARPAVAFVGGADVDRAVAGFEVWAREHAGCVCEIGLSGSLVHTCVVPDEVVQAASGDEDALLDYARLQFEHYFGLSGSAWVLSASRDARAALVCALSADLLQRLRDVAASHHVSVRRVSPWWVRGVQAALREALQGAGEPRAVAAVEPGRTTLVVAQGGRIARVVGEASSAPADWRARLQDSAAAASLWSIQLGSEPSEQQAQTVRGLVQAELVCQRIEEAA